MSNNVYVSGWKSWNKKLEYKTMNRSLIICISSEDITYVYILAFPLYREKKRDEGMGGGYRELEAIKLIGRETSIRDDGIPVICSRYRIDDNPSTSH